jgi:hypothetical protein
MKTRIPELHSPDKTAARLWMEEMHKRGLLFCMDDRPEDIVDIQSGEQRFTESECATLNQYLESLYQTIGDAIHEIAFDVVRQTLLTKAEREATDRLYG